LKAKALVSIQSGIQDDRDAEDLARRALQKMKHILRFAVAKGYLESSPIGDTRPADFLRSHTVENFARTDAEDLAELLKKIETYQGTPITRLGIKLMALTFVRTTPLILAEWPEIDCRGKRWKIPKEHMKGHNNPHIVPLAHQTIQVRECAKLWAGSVSMTCPQLCTLSPTFHDGTIDVDVAGMPQANAPVPARGFVGIAFRVPSDASSYDYVYIRPTNGGRGWELKGHAAHRSG